MRGFKRHWLIAHSFPPTPGLRARPLGHAGHPRNMRASGVRRLGQGMRTGLTCAHKAPTSSFNPGIHLVPHCMHAGLLASGLGFSLFVALKTFPVSLSESPNRTMLTCCCCCFFPLPLPLPPSPSRPRCTSRACAVLLGEASSQAAVAAARSRLRAQRWLGIFGQSRGSRLLDTTCQIIG